MVPQRAGLGGAWCHAAIVGPSRPRDQELACLLMGMHAGYWYEESESLWIQKGPVFPNTARRITIWIPENIDILFRYLPTQLPTQATWWIIYCILGVPRYSTARVQTFNLKMRNSGDKNLSHYIMSLRTSPDPRSGAWRRYTHMNCGPKPTQTRCYITCDCGSTIGKATAG
ncbi:hypothetical protein EDB89DRAFT_1983610 [Lactarius sanguifluus]|nr:hypothetical protein EDB89DRAFT_1983610 [Lactarius sanguifluus]